jgi:hypothetical protein
MTIIPEFVIFLFFYFLIFREERIVGFETCEMSRSDISKYVNTMHKAKKEGRVSDAPTTPTFAPFGQKFFVWTWWSPEGPYPLTAANVTLLPIGMTDTVEAANELAERVRDANPVLKDVPINVTDTGFPVTFPFNPEPGVKRIFQAGEDQERAQQNWDRYSAKNQAQARAMMADAERAKRRMTKQEKDKKKKEKGGPSGVKPPVAREPVKDKEVAVVTPEQQEQEQKRIVTVEYREGPGDIPRDEIGPENFEKFSG